MTKQTDDFNDRIFRFYQYLENRQEAEFSQNLIERALFLRDYGY